MTKKLEKINKSTCLKLFEKKDMATMNNFCVLETERLSWQMSQYFIICKDNILITNYNQTLKTFNTLIQCMFSEYSGSLNGRNAYDKGFLIAIQAKR